MDDLVDNEQQAASALAELAQAPQQIPLPVASSSDTAVHFARFSRSLLPAKRPHSPSPSTEPQPPTKQARPPKKQPLEIWINGRSAQLEQEIAKGGASALAVFSPHAHPAGMQSSSGGFVPAGHVRHDTVVEREDGGTTKPRATGDHRKSAEHQDKYAVAPQSPLLQQQQQQQSDHFMPEYPGQQSHHHASPVFSSPAYHFARSSDPQRTTQSPPSVSSQQEYTWVPRWQLEQLQGSLQSAQHQAAMLHDYIRSQPGSDAVDPLRALNAQLQHQIVRQEQVLRSLQGDVSDCKARAEKAGERVRLLTGMLRREREMYERVSEMLGSEEKHSGRLWEEIGWLRERLGMAMRGGGEGGGEKGDKGSVGGDGEDAGGVGDGDERRAGDAAGESAAGRVKSADESRAHPGWAAGNGKRACGELGR